MTQPRGMKPNTRTSTHKQPASRQRPNTDAHNNHNNKTKTTATTASIAKEITDDHGRLATRVCIKNLPANTSAEQLKSFLSTATSSSKRPSSLVFTDCRILQHSKKTTAKSSSRASKATTATTAAPMAFCGFASPDMAQHVIRTFHKTYMGTHRLLVEAAVKKDSVASLVVKNESGDGTTTKRRTKSTNDDVKVNDNTKHSKSAAAAVLPKLQNINKPRSKPKIWENDDDDDFEISSKPVADDSSSQDEDDEDDMKIDEKEDEEDDSDEADSMADEQEKQPPVESKKTTNDAVSDLDFLKSKRKQVDDLEDEDADEEHDGEVDKTIENLTKTEAQHKNSDEEDDSDSESDSDSDDSDAKEAKNLEKDVDHSQKENRSTEITGDDRNDNQVDGADEEDPHRLFVRNLPFTASEKDLRSLFQEFGTITECYLPMADDNDNELDEERHPSSSSTKDITSRHNKGFAFVSFDTNTSATTARNQLDGSDFQGRLLHILPAHKVPSSKQNEKELDGDPKHLTYKQRQALERRQQEAAATNSNSWSTSFVRGDAVIDSLAEQLGLRKADIVNAKQDGITAGDAAVRLALGETHVIEENRNYFRSFGVDMDALVLAKKANSENADSNSTDNNGIVRSKTSILVKNLPFSTTLEELTKMFHGAVSTAADEAPKKILLPPSRTIALVQYANAANAKRAFRRLAYKRFQHVPLYLEWAPLAALGEAPMTTDSANETSIQASGSQTSSHPLIRGKELDAAEAVDDDDVVPGVSHTIYVKNLNFSTEESALRQVFSKHGTVRAVKIPQKLAPVQKKGSSAESDVRTLSMGYGFVELASSDEVRKALQQLQGTLLDGHAIELKPSNKEIAPKQQKSKLSLSNNTKNRTKLMVRNVAFQASRKELLQLFGSFGQLRKVRLPKKFDGTHRGFAFCEYLTHKEAEAAMQSLSQTHLYGRHLVLEWASEEDGVDVLEGVGNSEQSMAKLRDKAQRDVALEPTKKKRRVG